LADGKQNEPKTIGEVLMSVESRQFWERVYVTHVAGPTQAQDLAAMRADLALHAWRERFEPKAGD